MNHTYSSSPAGRLFRSDKPQWLRVPVPSAKKSCLDESKSKPSDCLANAPLFGWLRRIIFNAINLAVWSHRNMDACLTLIETGSGCAKIAGGDEIRVAWRIRLHQHFFPHYVEWTLPFPSCAGKPALNSEKFREVTPWLRMERHT